MWLKAKEPSSGNLMTRAGSFQNCTKTNHEYCYTEKPEFILGQITVHGKTR